MANKTKTVGGKPKSVKQSSDKISMSKSSLPGGFGSVYSGNPARPVIIIPNQVNKPIPGNPVDITIGTSDDSLNYFVQIYDSTGNLIGSRKAGLVGNNGDGLLRTEIMPSPDLVAGQTYFFRVYTFTGDEEISHTISIAI